MPSPAPSHRLSPSLPNPPIAPASLCDAISGAMPGPSGQGCCSCPSDITPARDGPAHAYPDDAVDGATRANRTSQYNAPSGVMKPVCRLTDRLPDSLTRPKSLGGGSGRRSVKRQTGFITPLGALYWLVRLARATPAVDGVVRVQVRMRRTITSRGDVRRAGAAALSASRTGR